MNYLLPMHNRIIDCHSIGVTNRKKKIIILCTI